MDSLNVMDFYSFNLNSKNLKVIVVTTTTITITTMAIAKFTIVVIFIEINFERNFPNNLEVLLMLKFFAAGIMLIFIVIHLINETFQFLEDKMGYNHFIT